MKIHGLSTGDKVIGATNSGLFACIFNGRKF